MKSILFHVLFVLSLCWCRAQEPKLILPIGHTGQIESVSFSQDGHSILTASDDRTAKLWEATTGKLLFTLRGHTKTVQKAVLSPDGKFMATASWDSTARIWDAASGRCLQTLKNHTDVVSHVSFSPDAKWIVTASWDGTAKTWEASTGRQMQTLAAHTDRLQYANFSPGGKFIVTSSGHQGTISDGRVKIWETATGRLLTRKEASFLMVGIRSAKDTSALTWPFTGSSTLTREQRRAEGSFSQFVRSAPVSGNGKSVITFKDSSVSVWEVGTGKLQCTLSNESAGVKTAVISPQGDFGVVVFNDSTAKLANLLSGKWVTTLAKADTAGFSPDGKWVVTTLNHAQVKVWEASSGRQVLTMAPSSPVACLPGFSPVGDLLVTALKNGPIEVRKLETGNLLYRVAPFVPVVYAEFSSDGSCVITEGINQVTKVWKAGNGTLLDSLQEQPDPSAVESIGNKYVLATNPLAQTSPHQNKNLLFAISDYTNKKFLSFVQPEANAVVTPKGDTLTLQTASTGSLKFAAGDPERALAAAFSADGRKLVMVGGSGAAVWDTRNGCLLFDLNGHTRAVLSASASPDGDFFITVTHSDVKLWEMMTGKLVNTLHDQLIYAAQFSPDGKSIITYSGDGAIHVWNPLSGTLVYHSQTQVAFDFPGQAALFSPDGKYLAVGCQDTLKIVDTKFWKTVHALKCNEPVFLLGFAPNGEKLITSPSGSNTPANRHLSVWETTTGKELIRLPAHGTASASFNPDGTLVATTSPFYGLQLWRTTADTLLYSFGENSHDSAFVPLGFYSPNGTTMVSTNGFFYENIFDTAAATYRLALNGQPEFKTNLVAFHPDGRSFVAVSYTKESDRLSSVTLFDAVSGKPVQSLEGQRDAVKSVAYSRDGQYIFTVSDDNTVKIWDASTGRFLYTHIAIDSTDYLVVDQAGRFDGSAPARKLLYFTCGTEVIELEQLKDQLWAPGLVEHLLRGEPINEKKLSDLNICGLTPLVKAFEKAPFYRFTITPRRGGLGETMLYVNNIEVHRYKPNQLSRSGSTYGLKISREELSPYFVAGQDNTVSVKALTKQFDIASRDVGLSETKTTQAKGEPRLFAVFVGVTRYKEPQLNLTFPGKDAVEMANVVGLSARRLLNTQTDDRVFLYLLSSEKKDSLPVIGNVREAFARIGKMATANDILLFFFAGHGIVSDKDKKFYFLTAEATSSLVKADPANAGISTDTLIEWIKPANIKAQKRILIFDACQSGQAINDFVTAGRAGQGYVLARSDDHAQQMKALDNLNSRSGLFILAGAASNQKAYEIPGYSHGILTYALLKAVKQHPDILDEGRYLNVSRWFNAAEKVANEIARKNNKDRQDPQVLSTANINIGMVDSNILAKIVLPEEKLLFTAGNFQNNDEEIIDDDLELSEQINQSLNRLSESGKVNVSYLPVSTPADSYSLIGRYKLAGDSLLVSVRVRFNKTVIDRFDLVATRRNLNILTDNIARKAIAAAMKYEGSKGKAAGQNR